MPLKAVAKKRKISIDLQNAQDKKANSNTQLTNTWKYTVINANQKLNWQLVLEKIKENRFIES